MLFGLRISSDRKKACFSTRSTIHGSATDSATPTPNDGLNRNIEDVLHTSSTPKAVSNSATESSTGRGNEGLGGGASNGSGSGGNGSNNSDGHHLPDDLKQALAFGSLTEQAFKHYYKALKNPMLKLLMAIPAYRSRALADSGFFFKLMVQELIGNRTSLASEIAVRGSDIVHELEYVASDLIVGTVIEAGFVWLLAPTLSLPSKGGSAFARFLSTLPSNMFQQSTALRQFSMSQRAASFVYAGIQYTAIGFVAGIVGTAITYALIEGRKRLDKTYQPERPLPAVILNSAAWGVFMGISSNTRFQLVEGLELGIANLFNGKAKPLVNSSIIALRFANNYWGGVQFVRFFRYLGLHATGEKMEQEAQH